MKPYRRVLMVCAVAAFLSSRLPADVLEMQNGDRYNGKVLSVSEAAVVLQNEVLGKLTVPRARVTAISFGTQVVRTNTAGAPTNTVKAGLPKMSFGSGTNSSLSQLASQPGLVKEIESEFLSGADAAAHDKFNNLVSGLMTGRLSVEDIRREAKTTADQVRALRKEVGEDAGFALDGYLAILDQFLGEAPAGQGSTNKPAVPKPNRQNPSEAD